MRVALLTHHAPAGDAIANQLAEKVAFFHDRGAQVRVFLESDRNLNPALRDVATLVVQGRPEEQDWQFLTTADLVIADYGHYYPLLQVLPCLAGGRPRLVFDYHGVTPREFWPGEKRELVEAAARWRGLVWCADVALAHSQFARQELIEATGFPPERITCLPYVIDGQRFTPGVPKRSLRDLFGLSSASLMLYVGRLAANKRVPLLIDALARLRERTPVVHLVLIGDCSDIYQQELRVCQERAAELGVADRLHCLGHVSDEQLVDAYRSADVLVLPSRHEAFGMPVVEAMACGLPVVAARACALPETVAGAGLTFTPEDPEDLARQLGRVFDAEAGRLPVGPCRVAVVSFRYGGDFVGGAETSLRTIAEALHHAGHAVEVFTTCTRSVAGRTNDLPEGSTVVGSLPVHRFRVDAGDHARHLETVRAVRAANGQVPAEVGQAYYAHSIHSTGLIQELQQRIDDFDAVIVGPYLLGLTHAVATAFANKALVLPCFHDEGFAHLSATREAYEQVAGLLYHSPEEQEFAERCLGINHPAAACIGTYVDTTATPDRAAAIRLLGKVGRYVVYCGRHSEHKGVPRLIEFARRYHERSPGRFTFVFLGQGEVAIPAESWAYDLGFVEEATRSGLLAGAAALVQLSRQESLSLVALESWALGTPVLADAGCAVLAGQIRRSGGGQTIADFESFAAALDQLWSEPARWQGLGLQGQRYVESVYGSREALAARVTDLLHASKRALREQMCRQGLTRTSSFDRAGWRARFGNLIEELLHAPARLCRHEVEIRVRQPERHVSAGTTAVLIPVQLSNRGTHALVPEGPARTVLRYCILGAEHEDRDTALPGLLLPGRTLAAAVPVTVPERPGTYEVGLWAQRPSDTEPVDRGMSFQLVVEQREHGGGACCAPLLEMAETALVEAQRLERLPDTFTDVTEGWFARGKRWLKRKLLGNFKHAYVDVLSRQQSTVNAQLVTAVRELAECCATLDHAVRHLQEQLQRQTSAFSSHAPRQAVQRIASPPQAAKEKTGGGDVGVVVRQ